MLASINRPGPLGGTTCLSCLLLAGQLPFLLIRILIPLDLYMLTFLKVFMNSLSFKLIVTLYMRSRFRKISMVYEAYHDDTCAKSDQSALEQP